MEQTEQTQNLEREEREGERRGESFTEWNSDQFTDGMPQSVPGKTDEQVILSPDHILAKVLKILIMNESCRNPKRKKETTTDYLKDNKKSSCLRLDHSVKAQVTMGGMSSVQQSALQHSNSVGS